MQSITIRVSDDLKDFISSEADLHNQTQSDYLRQLIKTYAGQITHADQLQGTQYKSRDTSQEISLSTIERKILLLGHELLLASSTTPSSDSKDQEIIKERIEALKCGYAGEYPKIFSDIDDGLSYDECRLVWDILDMFRVIKYSIEKLGDNGWEKTGVTNASDYGTFKGFDFQTEPESKLAGYTSFLVNSNRWTEQASVVEKDGGNSHREMLPTYLPMLAEFKPLWRNLAARGGRLYLTPEEIKNILLAAPGSHVKRKNN